MTLVLGPASAGAASHAAVRMPTLVGDNRAQVFAVMHRHGLFFVTKGPGSSNSTWKRVTSETPRAGSSVAWHSEAVLHVTNAVFHGPRRVPDVVGDSRAQVYQAMHRSQLYFRTLGPGSTNDTWKIAIGQSPRAGTRMRWHGEVAVHVAYARPKPVVKAPVASAPVTEPSSVVNGSGYKIGVATWYDWRPGQCATWYLPKGTRLTVEDLATKRSVTCVITDREPRGGNRVVDLDASLFAELAPLSTGVIDVKVTW